MKTELEAQKCVCPHITYNINPYRGENFWTPEYVQADCQGARCMMWRWGQEKSELGGMQRAMRSNGSTWSCAHCDALGKHSSFVNADNPDGWCPECDGEGHGFNYEPAGFCGLAGVPA